MKPNYHLLPQLFLWVIVFTSACAPAPDAPQPSPAPAPAPVVVEMVVVADKAVYIRLEPSESAPLAEREALHRDEVVTVSIIRVVGESRWCRHVEGWSNCRWLRVTE